MPNFFASDWVRSVGAVEKCEINGCNRGFSPLPPAQHAHQRFVCLCDFFPVKILYIYNIFIFINQKTDRRTEGRKKEKDRKPCLSK